MKTNLLKLIVLMFTATLLFTGCSEDSSTDSGDSLTGSTQATSDMYGTWVYVDDGTKLEVLSSSKFDYTTLGENLLEVTTSSGRTRHLLRSSVANTNTSGSVVDGTTASLSPKLKRVSSRAISGIGGIEIILRNSTDNGISTTTYTQSDGIFTDTTLPSGTYSITGSDGTDSFTTEVTLDGKNTELGNFQLPDAEGYNFKTELILDNEYIYADETIYTGYIRVHNIGTKDGLGLAYDVTMDDYYKKSFDANITLGTVVVGGTEDIPISFSLNTLIAAKRTVAISTRIRDVNGNIWDDIFGVKVFRRSMAVTLASQSESLNGYLVMDGHKIARFEEYGRSPSFNHLETTRRVIVPVDPSVKYSVLFSNPNIEEETTYSLGIDRDPSYYYYLLNEPIAHEPNNNESEATSIVIGTYPAESYLHEGDIDFWNIDLSSEKTLDILEPLTNVETDTSYDTNLSLSYVLSYNESAIVSLTNGTLLKNGLAVTDNSGTFSFEDNVTIRLQSSTELNTTTNTTLTVGNYIVPFTLTTRLLFRSISNDIVIYSDSLMWDDSILLSTTSTTYDGAVNYCATSTLGNYSDWYLPDLSQLTILANQSDGLEEFQNIVIGRQFWSSEYVTIYAFGITPIAGYETIYLDTGVTDSLRDYENSYFICVRDTQ